MANSLATNFWQGIFVLDVKILRKIISMRKRDRAELDEEEAILELYLRALGMLPGLDDE